MKKVKALGVVCGLFIVMVMFCMLYLWTATETKISYAKSGSLPAESVYAVEVSQTYVQFDEQGISPIFVEYGATNVQFPVPESDSGKEFQGWYYNGIMYADAEGQQVVAWDIQAEEVTLSAKWSVEKYTIKTTYGGKTYYYSVQSGWAADASYRVEYGAQLNGNDQLEEDFRKLEVIENKTLSKFTRNGADFKLRDKIPDLGASGEVVELTPCFEDETHRIYYDLNGGEAPEGFEEMQEFVSGTNITNALPILENDPDGHQFVGWRIKGCPENPELVGELIGNIMPDCTKAQGNGHIQLKAAWRYKIIYNLDGGRNASGNPTSYTFEDEIILKSPTRTNYDFKGWFTDSQYTQQCTEIKDKEEDIILYAKWEGKWFSINCHNVKFQYDTAYGGPSRYQYGVGIPKLSSVSFHIPYPDREAHCEFVCWCLDAALTKETTSISKYQTGTVNLYARWRYISPNCGRYADYTITDSGRFNQRWDEVPIGMTWGTPGYDALKAMGFKYFVLQIELTAWEVNDGYQYIFIYDGESKNANLLAEQKFEISSSSEKVLPVFTFIIDIEKLKNVDVLYVRYGASGNWSDTWHTNEFKAARQYVVCESDIKIMKNGSIMW